MASAAAPKLAKLQSFRVADVDDWRSCASDDSWSEIASEYQAANSRAPSESSWPDVETPAMLTPRVSLPLSRQGSGPISDMMTIRTSGEIAPATALSAIGVDAIPTDDALHAVAFSRFLDDAQGARLRDGVVADPGLLSPRNDGGAPQVNTNADSAATPTKMADPARRRGPNPIRAVTRGLLFWRRGAGNNAKQAEQAVIPAMVQSIFAGVVAANQEQMEEDDQAVVQAEVVTADQDVKPVSTKETRSVLSLEVLSVASPTDLEPVEAMDACVPPLIKADNQVRGEAHDGPIHRGVAGGKKHNLPNLPVVKIADPRLSVDVSPHTPSPTCDKGINTPSEGADSSERSESGTPPGVDQRLGGVVFEADGDGSSDGRRSPVALAFPAAAEAVDSAGCRTYRDASAMAGVDAVEDRTDVTPGTERSVDQDGQLPQAPHTDICGGIAAVVPASHDPLPRESALTVAIPDENTISMDEDMDSPTGLNFMLLNSVFFATSKVPMETTPDPLHRSALDDVTPTLPGTRGASVQSDVAGQHGGTALPASQSSPDGAEESRDAAEHAGGGFVCTEESSQPWESIEVLLHVTEQTTDTVGSRVVDLVIEFDESDAEDVDSSPALPDGTEQLTPQSVNVSVTPQSEEGQVHERGDMSITPLARESPVTNEAVAPASDAKTADLAPPLVASDSPLDLDTEHNTTNIHRRRVSESDVNTADLTKRMRLGNAYKRLDSFPLQMVFDDLSEDDALEFRLSPNTETLLPAGVGDRVYRDLSVDTEISYIEIPVVTPQPSFEGLTSTKLVQAGTARSAAPGTDGICMDVVPQQTMPLAEDKDQCVAQLCSLDDEQKKVEVDVDAERDVSGTHVRSNAQDKPGFAPIEAQGVVHETVGYTAAGSESLVHTVLQPMHTAGAPVDVQPELATKAAGQLGNTDVVTVTAVEAHDDNDASVSFVRAMTSSLRRQVSRLKEASSPKARNSPKGRTSADSASCLSCFRKPAVVE